MNGNMNSKDHADGEAGGDEYNFAEEAAPSAMNKALSPRGAMLSSMRPNSHNQNRGVSTRSFFDGMESIDESWDGDHNAVHTAAAENERRKQGIQALYRRESRAVVILRICVYTGLILTGVLVAVAVAATFSLNQKNENAEPQQEAVTAASFQTQFDVLAGNWHDSLAQDLSRKLATIDSASLSLSSYARQQQRVHQQHAQQQQQQASNFTASPSASASFLEIWPNVTMPEFALFGDKTNSLADTLAVFVLPLVSQAQKASWQEYATKHYSDWLEESLAYQLKQRAVITDTSTVVTSTETSSSSSTLSLGSSVSLGLSAFPSQIQTAAADSTVNQYYLPLWQLAPAMASPGSYNVDLLSATSFPSLARSLNQLLVTRRAVLTPALSEQELEQILMHRPDNDGDNIPTGPVSLILYPLFGGETATGTPSTGELVGVYAAAFSWQTALSKSVNGHQQGGPLVAVLENDCNQAFTFRIDDKSISTEQESSVNDFSVVSYQGPGNLQQDVDTIVVESPSLYLTQKDVRFASVAPGAVPLDQDFCQYKMQVYGTEELQQQHHEIYQQQQSSEDNDDGGDDFPAFLYAVIVSCVFCFTFIAFVMYNWLVERRQRIALEQAVQSTALVSTLFPEAVRDRLLQAHQKQKGGVDSCHGGDIVFSPKNEPGTIPMTAEASSSGDHDDVSNRGGDCGAGDLSCRGGADDMNILTRSPTRTMPSPRQTPKLRLKTFLRDAPLSSPILMDTAKPIADFFPHCTVLFADISGFTAWSSQREPTQVFTLLQNIYAVFDKQAQKRGVFKVETIGDSYVAVTGLPDPQPDHAIIMAKFAMECRSKMREVTKKLVRTLGPETEDLQMRFGLNSGPVTAGVLGGTAARFQLFGDTVNTAARMESTGEKNRIHLSEYTAALLVQAGKEYMVTKRDGLIAVKGKGNMSTYWLEGNISNTGMDVPPPFAAVRRQSTSTYGSSIISVGTCDTSVADFNVSSMDLNSGSDGGMPSTSTVSSVRPRLHDTKSVMWGNEELPDNGPTSTKLRRNTSSSTSRLIDWNVDMLLRLLKQVEAKRQMRQVVAEPVSHEQEEVQALRDTFSKSGSVVDEVAEIIQMPSFEAQTVNSHKINPDTIVLDDDIEMQLREFVTVIASMYRDNPFHNFEHACHVQMSMTKLLERVVNPDDVDYNGEKTAVASDVHNYTYGITSDPLTQFTVVFCALIHDVDHTGVSNGQLVKEKAHIATLYKNKSVAEQNSIDLAWDLLMQDDYEDLRRCIYANADEFKRFRQLVVNTVLATDIFDKELSALRKNRWAKAFSEVPEEEPAADTANRKATIVIEHLIQGSDVSHTMQHWEIYKKWNERLFYEMYLSFKDGRTDTDPSSGWYNGELWFFDNYVIPLAKKLKDCGVFGVCSDECLNYAMENRRMWEVHGEEVVANMLKTDYYEKLKMEKDERKLARRRRLQYQKTADSGELKALAAAAEVAKGQGGPAGAGDEGQEVPATPTRLQGLGGLVAPRRRPSTTTASAAEAAVTTGYVAPS